MAPRKICLECGHAGSPRRLVRGTFKMELVHWFFFMVSGPFYSVWRRTGRETACAHCHSTDLIMENSIAGRKWLDEMAGMSGTARSEMAKTVLPHQANATPGAVPREARPVEIDPRNYRF